MALELKDSVRTLELLEPFSVTDFPLRSHQFEEVEYLVMVALGECVDEFRCGAGAVIEYEILNVRLMSRECASRRQIQDSKGGGSLRMALTPAGSGVLTHKLTLSTSTVRD